MNDATRAMAGRLEKIDWFSNCGNDVDGKYERVRKKSEALRAFGSRKWYNFFITIHNSAMERLWPHVHGLEWYNDICDEVCGREASRVFSVIQGKVESRLTPDKRLQDIVKVRIGRILWEIEFERLASPLFHVPICLPIFEQGHLPCGWVGTLPPEDWRLQSPDQLPLDKLRVY